MDGGVGEAGDGDFHLGGAALRKHGEMYASGEGRLVRRPMIFESLII